MEAIAEINDLACRSIEMGDYHIALDVLNNCLGCVKQLKKFLAPLLTKSTSRTAIRKHKAAKECIARTLSAAKRKLLDRSKFVLKTNFAEGKKHKRFNSSMGSRKRKRELIQQDNEEFYHNAVSVSSGEVSSTSSNSVPPSTTKSRYPFSATTESLGNCDCNKSSHNAYISCQQQDKIYRHDTEELFFVYRKPFRLSIVQWTRIGECRYQENQEGVSNHQHQIQREVELAVSANLIFNIALCHQLIASLPKNESGIHHFRNIGLSPESGEDTDDEDEEENDRRYDFVADALQTKQRLKGALRLYELGFRVHTKRVAFVMSSKGQSTRRGDLYPLTPSIPSLPISIPLSSRESQVQHESPSPNDLRHRRRRERHGERDDELKSTTRFALALLNNCAHIHNLLGQSEKANIFQRRLLSFLLVIVDSGESVHDVIGDDHTVDGYLKNVFAGTVFNHKTAPAAMA
jgi:hypothetical protein